MYTRQDCFIICIATHANHIHIHSLTAMQWPPVDARWPQPLKSHPPWMHRSRLNESVKCLRYLSEGLEISVELGERSPHQQERNKRSINEESTQKHHSIRRALHGRIEDFEQVDRERYAESQRNVVEQMRYVVIVSTLQRSTQNIIMSSHPASFLYRFSACPLNGASC